MSDLDNEILNIRTQIDEKEECEIEVIPIFDVATVNFDSDTTVIEQRLHDLEIALNKRDEKIAKLESHADGSDYAVMAACGLLKSLLDVFFVCEFSLESDNK